jgi:hypothetical protein
LWDAAPGLYVLELLNMYLRRLPGHPDSGRKITREFRTNAEVVAYTEERLQAAKKITGDRNESNGTPLP